MISLTLEKNRRFSIALIILAILVALSFLAGPPLVHKAVGRLYHSSAPLWQGLFQQRQSLGLEPYQRQAADVFLYGVGIGATLALALFWVMWDHEGDRFSLAALALPRLNARLLAVIGTGALILLSVRGQILYLAPLLAGLVTLLAREDWRPFGRLNRILDAVLRPQVSLPLVFVIALATFFVKFPPADFDKLVFFDDYPTIYTVTAKGWEMLKQGGIFGWDPAMMGGYYTVSDVSHNEIFFMLPFLPLGLKVGFHLMILFFYLLFPFLIYLYARLRFGDERPAVLALWIALLTAFGFFDNLLYWGMVNSFIGLNLMLVNLIAFAMMRREKPYASFALILSLPLTLYAAGGFFVYSLLLIGIDFVWHFDKRMVPRLAFVMSAAFVISLTYAYSFLRYPGYFIQSDEIYAPHAYGLAEIIAQSLRALSLHADPKLWLLGRPVRYQGAFIVSIPILLALGWGALRRRNPGEDEDRARGATAEVVAIACALMLISLLVSPSVDMFVSRIRFALPVFLALAYGAWLARDRRLHPAPLLIVLTILLATLPSRLLEPIPHVANLRAYNAPLLDRIESLDSDILLLESMGGYDLATEGPGRTQIDTPPVHLESYFAFETSKRYLANNQEGYHHSVYRRNFITSGAFRGRLLPDWPREEITSFLKGWGVRHLVVWSQITRGYLESDPAYRRIWDDGFWFIYEFAEAEPGDAVMQVGRGEIVVEGYFEQRVQLQDARKGELVRLRMNYFPAWRATHAGQDVDLLDEGGFMAFVAPADGAYALSLSYPRYVGLSISALITIVVSFWVSRRYKGAL